MAFEVRVNGECIGVFPSQEAAIEQVRQVVLAQPDSEPEILDSETGRGVLPASSLRWREHLAKQVGY